MNCFSTSSPFSDFLELSFLSTFVVLDSGGVCFLSLSTPCLDGSFLSEGASTSFLTGFDNSLLSEGAFRTFSPGSGFVETSFLSNFIVSATEEVGFLSKRTFCSLSLITGCFRGGISLLSTLISSDRSPFCCAKGDGFAFSVVGRRRGLTLGGTNEDPSAFSRGGGSKQTDLCLGQSSI